MDNDQINKVSSQTLENVGDLIEEIRRLRTEVEFIAGIVHSDGASVETKLCLILERCHVALNE